MEDEIINNSYAEELLDTINHCKDDDLKKIITYYKNIATSVSKKWNIVNFIGPDIDINPEPYDISDLKKYDKRYINCNNYYTGYILDDVKIVYSMYTNFLLQSYNQGHYYYMDNDDYLLGFIEYIKDKKINCDEQLIINVSYFLKKYFSNCINNMDRESMYHGIIKKDELYYEVVKEHSIIDFKGKGTAMCSEYSAVAQNILSFFGYDITYILGSLNSKEDNHVFNIIYIKDKYYLLDFSKEIVLYNYDGKKIQTLPFIGELNDFDDDMYDLFLEGNCTIDLDNYDAYKFNNFIFEYPTNIKREYKLEKSINYE